VLVVTLTFLCAGSLIYTALSWISLRGLFVLTHRDWIGISDLPGLWAGLMAAAALTGPVGLIAGICEILFGQTNARAVFVISLVVFSAALIPGLIHWLGEPAEMILLAIDYMLGLVTTGILSFVLSILACWKLIEIMRRRMAADEGLSPP
jgi:hypothetical protein